MPPPQIEAIESRLKQLHEYNRHTAQLIVAWFTFFVTANCAVMGWLLVSLAAAKSGVASHPFSGRVLPVIAVLFAFENILGICACLVVRSHLFHRASLAHDIEDSLSKPDTESHVFPKFQTVPVDLYSKALLLMMMSLIFILLVWCSLPFLCK
jgi:hypothetical protein